MVAVEGKTDEDDKYLPNEEENTVASNLYPGSFTHYPGCQRRFSRARSSILCFFFFSRRCRSLIGLRPTSAGLGPASCREKNLWYPGYTWVCIKKGYILRFPSSGIQQQFYYSIPICIHGIA